MGKSLADLIAQDYLYAVTVLTVLVVTSQVIPIRRMVKRLFRF